jgi:hypothetical protein
MTAGFPADLSNEGQAMRIQLLSLLLLSGGISAGAATLQDFVIVNSTSLSDSGGIFTSGGGTFSGQFQVDVSQIPPGGNSAALQLASWDIFVTGPGTFNVEFAPGVGSGSNLIVEASQNLPGLGNFQIDALVFTREVGTDVFQLTLSMAEPVGFFRGGVVIDAVVADHAGIPPSTTTMSDVFGTGLVVDPAILAPEPGCGLFLAGGLSLIAAGRRRSK